MLKTYIALSLFFFSVTGSSHLRQDPIELTSDSFKARFHDKDRIGEQSGEGIVYKAECRCIAPDLKPCRLPLKRGMNHCAVKLVSKVLNKEELDEEIEAMRSLQTIDSVVKLYGTADQSYFSERKFHKKVIIMELVKGDTIRSVIKECDSKINLLFDCTSQKILDVLQQMQPYNVYHTDLHSGNIMVPPGDNYQDRCEKLRIIDFGNVQKSTDDLVPLNVLAHALFRFAERSELIAETCRRERISPSVEVRARISQLLDGREPSKLADACQELVPILVENKKLPETFEEWCPSASEVIPAKKRAPHILRSIFGHGKHSRHSSIYSVTNEAVGCSASFDIKKNAVASLANVFQTNCKLGVVEFECIVQLFPKSANIDKKYHTMRELMQTNQIYRGFISIGKLNGRVPKKYRGPAVIQEGRPLAAELADYPGSDLLGCYVVGILNYMQEILKIGFYVSDIKLQNWMVFGGILNHSCKRISIIDLNNIKEVNGSEWPVDSLVEALIDIAEIVKSKPLQDSEYGNARVIINDLFAGRGKEINSKCHQKRKMQRHLLDFDKWCSSELGNQSADPKKKRGKGALTSFLSKFKHRNFE